MRSKKFGRHTVREQYNRLCLFLYIFFNKNLHQAILAKIESFVDILTKIAWLCKQKKKKTKQNTCNN